MLDTSESQQTGTPFLRRSKSDRIVGGVCGGLGRYFGIDPVWLRIAFVALVVGGGSGIILYIVAWILIPEEDEDAPVAQRPPTDRTTAGVIIGTIFIVFGAVALTNRFVPWFDDFVWPAVVIAIGLGLVVGALKR